MRFLIPLAITSLGLFASASGPSQDRTQDRLDEASETYRQRLSELQEQLELALVAEVSDEHLALRRERELESFRVENVLPASVPDASASFERGRRRAAQEYGEALEGAVAAFERASMHSRADQARSQLEEHAREAATFARSDLRREIELDKVSGWHWDGAIPVSSDASRSLLPISSPRTPRIKSAYHLRLEFTPQEEPGGFQLMLWQPGSSGRCLLVVGGTDGRTSGLERVAGERFDRNATATPHAALEVGASNVLEVECSATSVSARLNGRELSSQADWAELTLPRGLEDDFAKRRTWYLVRSEGTPLRLDSITFEPLEDSTSVVEAGSSKRSTKKQTKTDYLRAGRKFGDARNSKGRTVNAVVTSRNRADRTATLSLTFESGAVYKFFVTTRNDGKTGSIQKITNSVPAPGQPRFLVTNESGSLKATSNSLDLKWKSRGSRHGQVTNWNQNLRFRAK